MGVQVQVSARILRWPPQCARCLGPADQSYHASFTRVTGKRVVRSDERGWDVPYCARCFRHADEHERAETITTAPAYAVLLAGVGLGLVLLTAGGAFGCLPLTVQPRAVAGGVIVMALAAAALGVAAGAGAVVWFRQLHATAVRRRRAAHKHAKSLASARCCTLRIAVAYEGWAGSVHTFWFANPEYARAFIHANASKVLRP